MVISSIFPELHLEPQLESVSDGLQNDTQLGVLDGAEPANMIERRGLTYPIALAHEAHESFSKYEYSACAAQIDGFHFVRPPYGHPSHVHMPNPEKEGQKHQAPVRHHHAPERIIGPSAAIAQYHIVRFHYFETMTHIIDGKLPVGGLINDELFPRCIDPVAYSAAESFVFFADNA